MSEAGILERYRPLVEDFDAFVEACHTPLPTVFWRNSLRFSETEFSDWFISERDNLHSLDWSNEAFKTADRSSFPFVLAYLGGLIHIQEETSLIPVSLLEPQPGERILDLCAAPGNKTAQIAVAMGNSGTVVANDISRTRLGVVRTTMDRLGLTSVVLTAQNALSYPTAAGIFDRILVDVPCTCEGTSRKYADVFGRSNTGFREKLIREQQNILERALELCRPGGRVVYAACTYAPEECEGVISHVLDKTVAGKAAHLLPICLNGLRHTQGLTEWKHTRYPDQLKHAIRVWPHLSDTGGFFAAVIEITPTNTNLKRNTHTRDLQNRGGNMPRRFELPELIREETDWFRIPPEAFHSLAATQYSRKYCSLIARTVEPPPQDMIVSSGVRAINLKGDANRLSTAGAMLLGPTAVSGIVDVGMEHARSYLSRESITLPDDACLCPGPSLVRIQGKFFGRAFARRDSVGTRLDSFFPRIWAGVQVASHLRNRAH